MGRAPYLPPDYAETWAWEPCSALRNGTLLGCERRICKITRKKKQHHLQQVLWGATGSESRRSHGGGRCGGEAGRHLQRVLPGAGRSRVSWERRRWRRGAPGVWRIGEGNGEGARGQSSGRLVDKVLDEAAGRSFSIYLGLKGPVFAKRRAAHNNVPDAARGHFRKKNKGLTKYP